jgi:hypothetical protein
MTKLRLFVLLAAFLIALPGCSKVGKVLFKAAKKGGDEVVEKGAKAGAAGGAAAVTADVAADQGARAAKAAGNVDPRAGQLLEPLPGTTQAGARPAIGAADEAAVEGAKNVKAEVAGDVAVEGAGAAVEAAADSDDEDDD